MMLFCVIEQLERKHKKPELFVVPQSKMEFKWNAMRELETKERKATRNRIQNNFKNVNIFLLSFFYCETEVFRDFSLDKH